jgi:hypothetical protein
MLTALSSIFLVGSCQIFDQVKVVLTNIWQARPSPLFLKKLQPESDRAMVTAIAVMVTIVLARRGK